jgi:hypothetical protein
VTTLASSYSPTVRFEVDEPWGISTSLSYGSYPHSSPKLTVSLGDRYDPVERKLEAASARLTDLLALPDGWDGAKARRPSAMSAILSLGLIACLVDDPVPLPHFFPLPDGGIQIEWLIDSNGLEIEVTPDGKVNALGVDADGLTQIDEEFGTGTDGYAIVRTQQYLRSISKALLAQQ